MQHKKIINGLILIFLSMVWGASFIFMKKGLLYFSSVQVGALRLIFAFLFFLPVLLKIGTKGIRKNLKGLMWMGFLGNFIPAFLFTKAETMISSAMAGILNSTTPLFAWLSGYIIFKKPIRNYRNALTGFMLGTWGVVLLFMPEVWEGIEKDQWVETRKMIAGSLLVLLATVCYGLSVQGIHHYLRDVPSLHASAWGMGLLFPFSFLALLAENTFPSLNNPLVWKESLGYIALLGMAGSGLTLILYNTLIKRSGPVFASSCTYLIPFFSVLWGLADGEKLHFLHFAGLFTLLAGMFFIGKTS